MSTRNRAAFTLVELLVVIAIIGILVGFISAAAMQAINSAHRASCQNNQHEIWTAITIYESKKQRYPGWRTGVGIGAGRRQLSWAVQLMPYLGMNDNYNVWSTTGTTPSTPPTPGISLYLCPSDDQDTPGGPWLSYAVNTGISDSAQTSTNKESKANGLFFDNDTTVVPIPLFTSAADVQKKDGMTQTLGLGENRRVYNWSGYGASGAVVQEYLTGFVWDNSTTAPTNSWLKFPINQLDTSTGTVLTTTATDATGARISGPHGNVAVVTFVDGHSIFLNSVIDYTVYNRLCTPDGTSARDTSGALLNQLPLDQAEFLR